MKQCQYFVKFEKPKENLFAYGCPVNIGITNKLAIILLYHLKWSVSIKIDYL